LSVTSGLPVHAMNITARRAVVYGPGRIESSRIGVARGCVGGWELHRTAGNREREKREM